METASPIARLIQLATKVNANGPSDPRYRTLALDVPRIEEACNQAILTPVVNASTSYVSMTHDELDQMFKAQGSHFFRYIVPGAWPIDNKCCANSRSRSRCLNPIPRDSAFPFCCHHMKLAHRGKCVDLTNPCPYPVDRDTMLKVLAICCKQEEKSTEAPIPDLKDISKHMHLLIPCE